MLSKRHTSAGDAEEIQRQEVERLLQIKDEKERRKQTPETTPDAPEGDAQQKVIEELRRENERLLRQVQNEQAALRGSRLENDALQQHSCRLLQECNVSDGRPMDVKRLQEALEHANGRNEQLHQQVVEMHEVNGLQEVRSSVVDAELNVQKQEKFMADHEVFTLKSILHEMVQGRSQMEAKIHDECQSERSVALAHEAEHSEQQLEILSELKNARDESGRLQVQLHLAALHHESALRALTTKRDQALQELEAMSTEAARFQKLADSEQNAYYSLLASLNKPVIPSSSDTTRQLSEATLRTRDAQDAQDSTIDKSRKSFSEATLQPEGIDNTREQVDVLDAMLQLSESEGDVAIIDGQIGVSVERPLDVGHSSGSSGPADRSMSTSSPHRGREVLMPYSQIPSQQPTVLPATSSSSAPQRDSLLPIASAPQLSKVKNPLLAGDWLAAAQNRTRHPGSRSLTTTVPKLKFGKRPTPLGQPIVGKTTSPREVAMSKGPQIQVRAMSPRTISPVTVSTPTNVAQLGSTRIGSLSMGRLQRPESPSLNAQFTTTQASPQFAWAPKSIDNIIGRAESPRHPSHPRIVLHGTHTPVTPVPGIDPTQIETPRAPAPNAMENASPRSGATPSRCRITSSSPSHIVVSRSAAQLGNVDPGQGGPANGMTPPRVRVRCSADNKLSRTLGTVVEPHGGLKASR